MNNEASEVINMLNKVIADLRLQDGAKILSSEIDQIDEYTNFAYEYGIAYEEIVYLLNNNKELNISEISRDILIKCGKILGFVET